MDGRLPTMYMHVLYHCPALDKHACFSVSQPSKQRGLPLEVLMVHLSRTMYGSNLITYTFCQEEVPTRVRKKQYR